MTIFIVIVTIESEGPARKSGDSLQAVKKVISGVAKILAAMSVLGMINKIIALIGNYLS